MGSAEGIRQAEQALADAARSGKILLLKNTHLCSGWLASTLEKRMQTLRPNSSFRLFLTMEMSPKAGFSLLSLAPGQLGANLWPLPVSSRFQLRSFEALGCSCTSLRPDFERICSPACVLFLRIRRVQSRRIDVSLSALRRGKTLADSIPLPLLALAVHFNACFLHAILQERLSYVPLGFTKVCPAFFLDLLFLFRADPLHFSPSPTRSTIAK
jgi:hypothetical protein